MPPLRDDASASLDRTAFMPPVPGDAAASARRARQGPLRFALYMLAGGVVGALGAVFGRSLVASQPDWPWPTVSVPLALLATLLMLWPNIVLHEAGTWLARRLALSTCAALPVRVAAVLRSR